MNRITRRQATRALLVLAPLGLGGCRQRLACDDLRELTPAEVELRVRTFRYVDESPDPRRACAQCQLWKPPPDRGCGRCTVVRGPINPGGQCKSWAARPA